MEQYRSLMQELAAALRRDRDAQVRGDIDAIGRGYDAFDGRVPRDGTAESNRLLEALSFWDYWIDARNHSWTPFYDIDEGSWPSLADHVAHALTADEAISAPELLRLVQ